MISAYNFVVEQNRRNMVTASSSSSSFAILSIDLIRWHPRMKLAVLLYVHGYLLILIQNHCKLPNS